jgi:TPR repeat protein
MLRSALVAALLALLLTPLSQADESAYNKGVAAWRKQDYAEARKQWEASLAQGGPDEALNNLAYLLYFGLGGEAEPERAVELWRKGAALAVSEAQWHLGSAYESGLGLERNNALAYAWYRCAVVTAAALAPSDATEAVILRDAQQSLDKLRARLKPSEQAQGERMAAELIAKYSSRLSLQESAAAESSGK